MKWVGLSLLVFGVAFQISTVQAQALSREELMAEYYLSEAVDTINRLQVQWNASYKEYRLNGVTVAQDCVAFMDKSQVLGSSGKHIYLKFLEYESLLPNLVEGGSLKKHCSKYSSMKVEEKSLVWVVIMTMIAHFESSCRPQVERAGPNGTASGYYQLHLDEEAKYDGAMKLCQKGSSRSSTLSSDCALGIMQTQFVKQNNQLFSPKSYWDVLRPNGEAKKAGTILKAIQNIQLCNPTSV